VVRKADGFYVVHRHCLGRIFDSKIEMAFHGDVTAATKARCIILTSYVCFFAAACTSKTNIGDSEKNEEQS